MSKAVHMFLVHAQVLPFGANIERWMLSNTMSRNSMRKQLNRLYFDALSQVCWQLVLSYPLPGY